MTACAAGCDEPLLADTLGLMMPPMPVTLLLKAALLDAEAARAAWTQWRQTTEDPKAFLAADRVGIKRHLPLLYHNLAAHGIDIGRDLEPYFRAARAREELRGERFRRMLGAAVKALNQHDVTFVVGKGVTVGETIHDDPVLRHCHDIDLLVPTAALSNAGAALRDAGFLPSSKQGLGDEPRYDHESGLPVELHDRLYKTPFYDGRLHRIGDDAREGQLLGMPVKYLDDVTLLVQTPAHASVVPQRYGLSWIVDVVSLLKRRPAPDWSAVVAVAREHKVTLPLYVAYRYLAQMYAAPIPDEVIGALRERAQGADRLRHLAVIDGLRVGPSARIKPLWGASRWPSRRAMAKAMLLPPPAYLKARCGAVGELGAARLAWLYAARPLRFGGNQLNKAWYHTRRRFFDTSMRRAHRAFEVRLLPEERLLLGCLRQDFSPQDAKVLAQALEGASISWELVEANAKEQGVAPLIFANLRRCKAAGLLVPAEVLSRLRGAMFTAIKTKEEQRRWLIQALSYINSHNLDVMIVKGAALDIGVLKTPEYVVSLDIDLLIRKHYGQLSDEVCKPIWDFNRNGPLECDFETHHDLSIDELLSIDYSRMWNVARRIEIQDCEAWVMSPEDMLVAACTDACRKRYFHLKNLFNLHAIIDRFGDELDWDYVCHIARQQSCVGIVYTALIVADLAVGVDLGCDALRKLRPNLLRAQAIRMLAIRRSFTPVTQRSIVGVKAYTLGTKRVFAKSNFSLLLTYVAYTPAQGLRRLRWLLQTPEESKPGWYVHEDSHLLGSQQADEARGGES